MTRAVKGDYAGSLGNNNFRYADYRYSASRYNHFDNTYGATVQWNLFDGFATYNLVRAENMLAIAQIELNKAIIQLQSAIEGDIAAVPSGRNLSPEAECSFDKLLQKLADKFK